MSVHDFVFPLTEHLADWFRAHSTPLPATNGYGRDLTVREIRGVLDSLQGFRIEYWSSIHHLGAHIFRSDQPNGPNAYLEAFHPENTEEDYRGPANLCFMGSDRSIMLKIVHGLSAICGPLVVYLNSESPVLVMPTGEPVGLS